MDIDVQRILLPVEGFSVSHAEVAGVDILGIRDYVILESESQDVRVVETPSGLPWLELSTGFAQTADLLDGPVELHIPAKDTHGITAKLIFVLPRVEDWKLLVHVGGYRVGSSFTYREVIRNNHGTLDVIYDGDPAKTRHRISTNAHAWSGRG